MKVAFTSSDGITVDQHFGQTDRFFLWEVGPQTAQFLEHVDAAGLGGDTEDRTTARAAALEGCSLVYTVQVGGPAAAKLVARRVHPMKTKTEVSIESLVAQLQGVLKNRPPPWLRKAMGELPPDPTDATADALEADA